MVPSDPVNDHPAIGNICTHENWTVQEINTKMKRRAAIIGRTTLLLGAPFLILTLEYVVARRPAAAGPILTVSPWARVFLPAGVVACGVGSLALLEHVWV